MSNKTGLHPLGRAVLIEVYEPEIKKGVIAIPDQVKEKTILVEMRAIVIEAGPMAWIEETAARAQPGDLVLVAKYTGSIVRSPVNKQLYRVVNANDIFLRVDGNEMPSVAEAA